jgi:hypothetical protein
LIIYYNNNNNNAKRYLNTTFNININRSKMISSEALLSNESTQPEEKKPEPTKADQLPITTVDNSASISEEDQQLENSKTTLLEEQNENLNKLLNSVNYGIILAFFDKFAVHLSLKEIAIFKNFETSLINKKTCKNNFCSNKFSFLF